MGTFSTLTTGRAIGVLGVAFLITACGGGGGGGGSVATTTIIADEDPLALTQSVAASAVFIESFADGFAASFIGVTSLESPDLPATEPVQVALGQLASKRFQRRVIAGSFVVNAAVVTEEPCDNPGGKIVVDERETSVNIDFINCQGYDDSGVELAGTVNGYMDMSFSNLDSNPDPAVGANIRIDIGLTGTDANGDSLIDGILTGRVEWDYYGGSFVDVRLSTRSFLSEEYGFSTKLINFDSEIRHTNANIVTEYDGWLQGSDFSGTLRFYTSPVLRRVLPSDYYTSGRLRIDGGQDEQNDAGRITVTANGSEFPLVEIDADGDGVIEFMPTWSWDDDINYLFESL